MVEEKRTCGWRTIRKQAMHKVHERIKQREAELGRELSEDEFRDILRITLREEFKKAFEECKA